MASIRRENGKIVFPGRALMAAVMQVLSRTRRKMPPLNDSATTRAAMIVQIYALRPRSALTIML
jgi:hypothetical protein